MAESALSQAAVLRFLQERGGQVSDALLLSHFEPLLQVPGGGEPEERAALLERFVNDVAVVRELDGVKFVVLKEKRLPPELRAGRSAATPAGERPLGAEAVEEEEEEEEEGEGAAPLAPARHAASGVPPLPPDQEALEENRASLPVSQLKSLFQRGGVEPPKAPNGRDKLSSKAAPQKPCMLPVRCALPPRSGAQRPEELSPEQEQPESKDWLPVGLSAVTPSTSPYTKRRQLEETGPASPHLKRVPKSQKVGEEADSATTVPLEAAEHEWLVSATAGRWSQRLHGLLLSDKSLASKRDFMTGFTVLHWAAKTGNCDMLHKVIEVAENGGAHVNVNAKSYGGYTPLHIAAIHGQEEVIARLVKDYNAKVSLRDYSGKKPLHYLKEGSSFAVRHLLRDPDLHTTSGHNSIKKNAKVAASILSSTSTVLGLLSDDTAFFELTRGLKKPASLNKFLHAATAPRRKVKLRGTFSSSSSLSEAVEEEQEETTTKRRPVSELFFGH